MLHAIISFFFDAAVLALTINLAASLILKGREGGREFVYGLRPATGRFLRRP
jgi:hypothetical protein